MKLTELVALAVFRDDARVGTLRRTPRGSIFEYDTSSSSEPLAFGLATGQNTIETLGAGNVHPFFAGLLPEGFRLRALLKSVKTSEDDLFSLLAAAGGDCVGDIALCPEGEAPAQPPPIDFGHPEGLDFKRLLSESMARIGRRGDATLPGVQEKISASMVSLPVRGRGREGAFILKLNPSDKPLLVQCEAFFMRMAAGCGLAVAETRSVRDRSGNQGLLVRRFDRVIDAQGKLRKVHQEDACQFLGRYPADKYRLKNSELASGIERLASSPVVELTRYVELVAFSYLIGNGDLHGKNVSLLRSARAVTLTPAYDLLSTRPYGDRRMALEFEGRQDNLKRKHLLAFAARYGIREKFLVARIDGLLEVARPWLQQLDELGLPAKQHRQLGLMMKKRLADLS